MEWSRRRHGGRLQCSAGNTTNANDYTTNSDYVLSGGALCLTNAGALKSCDGSTLFPDIDRGAVVVPETIVVTFDTNLGANQAAYAIVFPELNALLASLSGDLTHYTMHVDVRMGCDPTLFGTMKMPWSVMAKL